MKSKKVNVSKAIKTKKVALKPKYRGIRDIANPKPRTYVV